MPIHRSTEPRRRSILDAALKCFTAEGYDNVSIEEICDVSGASVGSVYHHFGSKEGIASALYEEEIVSYQGGLLARLAAGGQPEHVIDALVRHHLTWVRTNPERARYLLQMGAAPATASTRPAVRRHNEDLLQQVAAWTAPHTANGDIIDLRPLAMVALLLGPSHALSRAWLAGSADLDTKTINQFAAAAVRAAVPG